MQLNDFAFFPRRSFTKQDDYLDYIAKYALTESWGENRRYLERYVDYNFQLSYEQGLVVEAQDRSYALWRVGNLVTRDNEPISISCLRNRIEGKQPYFFVRVYNSRRCEIRAGTEQIEIPAPPSPRYDIPEYQAGYDLVYQFDHYLEDNRERAEQALPGLTDHQRFLCVFASAHLAHKREAAVPQWYRDKRAGSGTYQWLLPLHISHDDISRCPDLVATLDPDDTHREYRIRTLLPPAWAYPNARVVSGRDPRFRAWAA